MLRVYVSAHCSSGATTRLRFARLRVQYPEIPAQLIDVDDPRAAIPAEIIGTPIYTWDHRVVFRGNPSDRELAAWLRGRDGSGTTRGPGETGTPLRG